MPLYSLYHYFCFVLSSVRFLFACLSCFLDLVYTVPDPHGHDIIINSFWTIVALKFTIILQNLVTGDHRKNDESKYDRELAKIDVVTTRIRYHVNGVLLLKSSTQIRSLFVFILIMSKFFNYLTLCALQCKTLMIESSKALNC